MTRLEILRDDDLPGATDTPRREPTGPVQPRMGLAVLAVEGRTSSEMSPTTQSEEQAPIPSPSVV